MGRRLAEFARDEGGATAIEYALIATLIAVAIIGAVVSVGTGVGTMFQSVSDKVTAVLAGAP